MGQASASARKSRLKSSLGAAVRPRPAFGREGATLMEADRRLLARGCQRRARKGGAEKPKREA
jgi:hypothetical protein